MRMYVLDFDSLSTVLRCAQDGLWVRMEEASPVEAV
jgi:hypothetical protein